MHPELLEETEMSTTECEYCGQVHPSRDFICDETPAHLANAFRLIDETWGEKAQKKYLAKVRRCLAIAAVLGMIGTVLGLLLHLHVWALAVLAVAACVAVYGLLVLHKPPAGLVIRPR